MNKELLQVADALNANGFDTSVFDCKEDAADAAMTVIGTRSVGIGGSMTVEETGLYGRLCAQGNEVHWHWKADDVDQARRSANNADVYLASSNAVSLDGHLINIDGTGNRVAAMVWGPGEVILIVGKNKIAADDVAALDRAKKDACGKNARRLGQKTPCATTDLCTDCTSPDRMCKVSTLIERKPNGIKRFRIYLVDEALGF